MCLIELNCVMIVHKKEDYLGGSEKDDGFAVTEVWGNS